MPQRPLTDRQKSILTGLFLEREDFAARTPRYEHGNMTLVREREKIEDAKYGLVAGNPSSWLGMSMTPSLYVMVSREYQRLEMRGLVVRHALKYSPTQTTHLSLTPEGEAIACQLLGVNSTTLPLRAALPAGLLNVRLEAKDPAP
jgi:hypothetical protein